MPFSEYSISISVVITVHNEEKENLEELYQRLTGVLFGLAKHYEIIFVDNASKGNTFDALKRLRTIDSRVKIIRFTRNFGQGAAFLAGFEYAQGEIIVTMDSDLQYTPCEIPSFLMKIEQGFDVVFGWRDKRKDIRLLRKPFSYILNKLIKRFIRLKTGINLRDYDCSFAAIRKKLAKQIINYVFMHDLNIKYNKIILKEELRFDPRFIKFLIVKITHSIAEINVSHFSRKRGKSGYTIFRYLGLGVDLLMNIALILFNKNKPLFIVEEALK